MTQLFTRALFVFVLLAGQWAYAEHSADALDGSHSHAIDCTLCLNQVNEQGSLATVDIPFDLLQTSTAILSTPLAASGSATVSFAIRAPPVNA
ncbi:hypothetical protein [Oceanicoccus sagamiensis]|uniref:Uncharacterized protein n=1 Tax=Oceanicoccus sagamiensis TaxID=716816 RepID=A0A1X9NEI7_9GAMM|nr:hypothetical protein [Oceanicoccus sagamiensis]ARN73959.1 hypothetical protein BST96_07415 [Oceanicoccus sagamiensis]